MTTKQQHAAFSATVHLRILQPPLLPALPSLASAQLSVVLPPPPPQRNPHFHHRGKSVAKFKASKTVCSGGPARKRCTVQYTVYLFQNRNIWVLSPRHCKTLRSCVSNWTQQIWYFVSVSKHRIHPEKQGELENPKANR